MKIAGSDIMIYFLTNFFYDQSKEFLFVLVFVFCSNCGKYMIEHIGTN